MEGMWGEADRQGAGECVKAGRDRCFCQRSNGRHFAGAGQMPLSPPSPVANTSHHLPITPPVLWTGPDAGITRQEQSSQRRRDRTGTSLHVDEVMERSRFEPEAEGGLSSGWRVGVGL